MKNRISLINSIIQKIIGEAIQEKVDQSHFGLITITRVSAAKRLDSVKIFVSAVQNELDLLPFLNRQIYNIQQILNNRMTIAHVPKIIFRYDDTKNYVSNIEEIIKRTMQSS